MHICLKKTQAETETQTHTQTQTFTDTHLHTYMPYLRHVTHTQLSAHTLTHVKMYDLGRVKELVLAQHFAHKQVVCGECA